MTHPAQKLLLHPIWHRCHVVIVVLHRHRKGSPHDAPGELVGRGSSTSFGSEGKPCLGLGVLPELTTFVQRNFEEKTQNITAKRTSFKAIQHILTYCVNIYMCILYLKV